MIGFPRLVTCPVSRPLNTTEPAQSRLGLIYGLGAYGLWGVIPLYFYALRDLPPLEVLASREGDFEGKMLASVVAMRA